MVKMRKKGFYSISAVAEMFSVHQQTIRLYEKEGLINPKRSDGNTRLFSEEDVDQLEEIVYLTHKVGINLAGVEMILKLQKKIERMQKEMNDVFAKAQEELKQEQDESKELVKSSVKRLMVIKNKNEPKVTATPTSAQPESADRERQQSLDIDKWEIEYDND